MAKTSKFDEKKYFKIVRDLPNAYMRNAHQYLKDEEDGTLEKKMKETFNIFKS